MSSEGDAPFMKTTYTPDYAEMFAVARTAQRYHFTSYQRYVWWLAVAVYFALIFSIATWGDPLERAAEPFLGRQLALFAPVALIFVLGMVFIYGVRRSSQTMSAKWLAQRKPLIPTLFTADAEHLAWENEEMSTRVRWRAIERLFVTPAAVCFVYAGQTLYLPRRLFPTETDLRAFIAAALPHLEPAAREASKADPLVKAALA